MTLSMPRVERHADPIRVEPLSRRIRLAACRPAGGEDDRRRRSMAAVRAARSAAPDR